MKPKVLLRDVEPGDLPLFFEHQRDPVAVAMVVFRSRERDEFDKHWAKILADETSLTKTIVADGQVAGHIASFLLDGKREIGYWIDRALWGRGIASEALSAFLRLEQRRPLHAGVAKHNLASMRVLQKCGFSSSKGSPDQEPEAAGETHILLTLT
ncbi:MAG TPA: GNAT family N-acetyltransferase [Chthoniobacterales bacterium]|nr:GNAT family N-acetyltransferase [Chthoniobacterales bacterium]